MSSQGPGYWIGREIGHDVQLSLYPSLRTKGSCQVGLMFLRATSDFMAAFAPGVDYDKNTKPVRDEKTGTLLKIDRDFYGLTRINAPIGTPIAEYVILSGSKLCAQLTW